MVKLCASEFFFVSHQVSELLGMFADSPTRIAVITSLLMRTVDYMNWTSQVFQVLTDGELRGLEAKIGALFYFTPSNPTGHYKLQLANPNERLIANKVIEISSEERNYRRSNNKINTSQKGDWDNWRNETLNGKPWDYDEKDPVSSKLPTVGVLEFDYVSTSDYHRYLHIDPIQEDDFLGLLADLRGVANVVTVIGTSEDRAVQGLDPKSRWKWARSRMGLSGPKTVTERVIVAFGGTEIRSHLQVDVKGVINEKKAKRPAWWIPAQNTASRCKDVASRDMTIQVRQLRMLRRSTLNYYYTAAQVEKLLSVLVRGAWLDALVTLFSRILDLENHHPQQYLTDLDYIGADFLALRAAADGGEAPEGGGFKFQRTDTSCYLMRLGHANCFNPFFPDRHEGPTKDFPNRATIPGPSTYHYDLRNFDERTTVKMLVALAAEKGESWQAETYNHNPIDLGKTWVEPEPSGPPKLGTLSLQFVTGPGTADLSLRANLARRLLMPGRERWHCVPKDLVDPAPTAETVNVVDESVTRSSDTADFDDTGDTALLCLDADGTLKSIVMVFRDFDRDHSGFLDEAEFKLAMTRLRVRADVADTLWEEADLGGDGEIDMDEWFAIWRKVKVAMSE